MQVLAKEANNVWSVHFNTARPAFAEADARRAISLAIDRDALVEGLDFGYGTSSSQILPASEPGSNPDIVPVYDPERGQRPRRVVGLERPDAGLPRCGDPDHHGLPGGAPGDVRRRRHQRRDQERRAGHDRPTSCSPATGTCT